MKIYETPMVQTVAVTAATPIAFGDNLLPLSSMVQPK